MPSRLAFEFPVALYAGLPVLALSLLLLWRGLAKPVPGRWRRVALIASRGAGLVLLLVLLARPVAVAVETGRARRTAVVLVDRSRSMGLADEGPTRYRQALEWGRGLLSALGREGFRTRTMAFDASAAPLDLAGADEAPPAGDRTDLAGAFLQAVLSADPAPAAVVALTDGAANRVDSNQAALLALIETRTPVVAVGFGRDEGVPTLSLRRVFAPARVPAKQVFRISAQLQSAGGTLPPFDLLLLRNGAAVQSRRVVPESGRGARLWSEGFDAVETEEGLYEYAVQLRLPAAPRVVSVNTRSSAPVRVGQDKEFRILYVQGALTWDFKFVSRALRSDPTVRVTGLSRTSRQSVFRQNLEESGELSSGFPQDLQELARYRVIVLSEMGPADLSPAQQDLVARFCSELGGGVLMIGGQSTFDEAWRGSRLEGLLPVALDARGVAGLDRLFHLRLTDEARRSPVFTVADDGSSPRVWDGLPTFAGYGRLRREKPGAIVWARHESDAGEGGKRVLIASQAYGAGVVAVIAVQNFWRWRLAKDGDPQTFDRFWRQLFRFLGQSGGEEWQIQILDQELRPAADVRALVERRPRPEASGPASPADYRVRVLSPSGKAVLDETSRFERGRPLQIHFRAEEGGVYTLTVGSAAGAVLASQPIEVLEVDREMERTGRDMETLRQWAAASQGLAVPVEEAGGPAAVATRLRARVEALRAAPTRRDPVGVNPVVLTALLLSLGGEWALRRKWGLR